MVPTILLTGGAGYIGSHTAYLLHTQGYQIVILDNFSHQQPFNHDWATVIKGDCGDKELLLSIFSTYPIDAVMHFAGSIEVGQSVKDPAFYYHNNVINSITLLEAMRAFSIKHFIFSSSCAVYGDPVDLPMTEDHPYVPLSPYGKNKLCVEFILQDYARAYGLRSVALRYFNAAGCWPEKGLGEYHAPETHIIPLLVRAALNQTPFTVFGSGYPTPDGTCIRDYVHVRDIAQAHLKAYDYLKAGAASAAFNLGTGTGHSVLSLIKTTEEVCRQSIIIKNAHRRNGDVHTLVACSDKAQKYLAWKPQHTDLNSIINDVYEWEKRRL
ncbi:MAG: UDP-glucose 4-epimerase GalE [Candidatus Babeliales bacterium]